ncbi:MAG: hypothetical protein ISR91_01860 [Candidatus Delongbacteria bacterium]|nr:hypothetical protein [Candidatus Delongbacteria bacterium]
MGNIRENIMAKGLRLTAAQVVALVDDSMPVGDTGCRFVLLYRLLEKNGH